MLHFNRFGQTLQAGERIDLGDPGGQVRAAYNPAVRKRILLSQSTVYRSQVSLLGQIAELDAEKSTFRLRTAEHGQVLCRFEPELFAIVRDALQVDGEGPLMRVDGVALRDRFDAIQRIESINDVSQVDDPYGVDASDNAWPDHPLGVQSTGALSAASIPRLINRLDELAELKDGWLDGDGLRVRPEVLALARHTLQELDSEPGAPSAADQLRIFPTVEGGLQFERTSGNLERSVELRPDLTSHFNQVDISSSSDDIEQEFPASGFVQAMRLVLGAAA